MRSDGSAEEMPRREAPLYAYEGRAFVRNQSGTAPEASLKEGVVFYTFRGAGGDIRQP